MGMSALTSTTPATCPTPSSTVRWKITPYTATTSGR